jgi:hypothetical protein
MEFPMKTLLVSTVAALTLIGTAALSTVPAQAQIGVQIGPGGVRIGEDRPRVERRIIERRSSPRRVIVEDDDEERCETRTQRTRVNGVWRTRRITVCD